MERVEVERGAVGKERREHRLLVRSAPIRLVEDRRSQPAMVACGLGLALVLESASSQPRTAGALLSSARAVIS